MGSFKDKDTNILFSDVTVGTALGGKYYNGNNGNFSDAATDGVETFVNAVEIDWNGAYLGEYIIKTTGQLLSYMSNISQKISNLENILINL